MRNKKKGNGLLTVIIAAVMLFSSMTAYAAEPPEKKASPTWKDVDDLKVYVGETVYEVIQEDGWVETEDVSTEVPYHKEGTLLASAPLERKYAAYVEEGGVFFEGKYDDTPLTEEEKSKYNEFYEVAIAFAGSAQTADGTKYVDDIMDSYNDFWNNTAPSLETMVESGKIVCVESEADAPDTASMEQGTYWVLGSDLDAYYSAISEASQKSESWDWPEGKFNSMRAEVLDCIQIVTNAYNTLLGKLHEGTAKTAAPTESLDEISSVPAVSHEDMASESPILTNEEMTSESSVLANEVMYTGGTKKQSTLEGVYCKNFVAGTIYADEPQKIGQAAGLSEKEMKDGIVIKYYICKSRNKEMNKMLSEAVSEQGYKVLGIMNNDLYKLAKGTVTKLKSTEEALTVVVGVPKNLRSDQYEFVIMCYDENGTLTVMPDFDNDKATLTVQAKCFGYWAVGYRIRQ